MFAIDLLAAGALLADDLPHLLASTLKAAEHPVSHSGRNVIIELSIPLTEVLAALANDLSNASKP